ncbi:MAG: rubredoxin [Clostridia bacterium]
MAKYVCSICGYIYDEQKQKVKFNDLPTEWKCPLCGASKSDFVKQEEVFKPSTEKSEKKTVVDNKPTLSEKRELTSGELNVLCTNLAKGCEKQYMDEESALFMQIADFYKKRIDRADNKTFVDIIALLNKDTSVNYVQSFEVAKTEGDRGALRVLTWSEKVTKIVSSLLSRYKQEGTAFLQNHKIFVCEICGFIYVGDEAPEICPICKVPRLKIHEVGGAE